MAVDRRLSLAGAAMATRKAMVRLFWIVEIYLKPLAAVAILFLLISVCFMPLLAALAVNRQEGSGTV
jgi:hypothetical protein